MFSVSMTSLVFPLTVSVLSSIIVFQYKDLKRVKSEEERLNNTEREAEREGIKALLRNQLIEMHDKYMERGSIPDYALESFNKMYKSYIDLHGNGMIPGMHKEVNKLEINRHYERGE